MNEWTLLTLIVAVMSLVANGFLLWMLRQDHGSDDSLIEELRGTNEILRDENKQLYERIATMAASIPHIRIVGPDEGAVEAVSNLAEKDDEGNIIGHKGAGVV